MQGSPDPDGTNENDWSIRREQLIEAPAIPVWEWLANPVKVSQWWCPPPAVTVDFEPMRGGYYMEDYRDGDTEYHLTGTIIGFDPGRRFSVRRASAGRFGPEDVIEFELLGASGGTVVILEHSFPGLADERRAEVEDFYAAGWNWSLGKLRELVTESIG